ncbi:MULTISPECIES: glycosyltransferase [Staphylococcus]|uniref:glycosyltransferase n=1 Tax=Staphylococcus TaxID=1279 RepID=UPI0008A339F2|nr:MULTISPECIES: glycosyltransferase [Staphylococcus]ARB76794.1 capsular biosynthesis protein [Staphylococcus lugdunensis]ARJ17835.1 capsular biosynthesis protein [Staphylococcus lugdunensis]MBM7133979.1 glycosyltransferase [Staphylococcus lugdunensis]MCH8642240.1 glycosyltransferase [Staphylococcus lugdunensis]MCH8644353.1 glycosyltransferase [Staphylococcus lugdunensis]
MKILNIVSSNIVQDPRILKQMETIKGITNTHLMIGMNNKNVTKERLDKLDFQYKLFGEKSETTSIFSKLLKRINFTKNVIKQIKKYQPNVIHANDFDVLLMVYLSGYKNANIIFDAHEIYAKNAFINKYAMISKIVEIIEKHIVAKRVDAFVTVSHAAKSYYLKKGYKKTPHVITNAPILDETIKSSDNNNDIKEVIYQGQIVSNRGYEEFVKAAAIQDNTKVNYVIRGFGPQEDEIKKLINSEAANVRLDKPVEMKDLVKKLTESDIGVVLTKPVSINYEYTVSNKIFECIHAGLPVILSPVKEHYYLNDKYNFGIVIDDVTPEKIAEAVNKLATDDKLYHELRQNAIKASKILSWQNESEKLKELYLNI